MGNRLVKPVPPGGYPFGVPDARGGRMQRPFPMLTPQSYIPGGGAGGLYPGFLPPIRGMMEPPILNIGGGGGMFPAPSPFPAAFPMALPSAMPFQTVMPQPAPLPPPIPHPNPNIISVGRPQPAYYEPGLHSCSHRRPVRICRTRRRRSRRHRPVIHVADSSSCSSLSSYTTISSCSRHRHRSRSQSRRCPRTPQQQQQQPIILLPMPVQQSAPAQPQIQPGPPQQIVLPPMHVQQPGNFQPQQLALPPIQQAGGHHSLALPPIQLSGSNLGQQISSSPIMISGGQSLMQPSMSMPQFTTVGLPQQIQAGPIQYVQAATRSSSPLQYVSAERRSTAVPQRVLVNSTNNKQAARIKPVAKSLSTRELPQDDLKYGRRPFDWYANGKKKHVINENIQLGQRGNTSVG